MASASSDRLAAEILSKPTCLVNELAFPESESNKLIRRQNHDRCLIFASLFLSYSHMFEHLMIHDTCVEVITDM